ncbi:MAG: hypothetical protein LBS89_02530, partial [Zoogloeaceae bacterium]|nr:hypothetical protein [Zoogloeaceae bacterium]
MKMSPTLCLAAALMALCCVCQAGHATPPVAQAEASGAKKTQPAALPKFGDYPAPRYQGSIATVDVREGDNPLAINFAGKYYINRHHCRNMDCYGELALMDLSNDRTLGRPLQGAISAGDLFPYVEERSLKTLAFEAESALLVIRFFAPEETQNPYRTIYFIPRKHEILEIDFKEIAREEAYPKDVRAFLENRNECEHFAGEPSYDAERARELNTAIKRYCGALERARQPL